MTGAAREGREAMAAIAQYPRLMKRFWKWTLISAASVALAVVLVIAMKDTSKPHKDEVTIVKPEYYSADGRRIAKPENQHGVTTLEERIDKALARAK
jgi:hypothetical protein